ncbi:MAG: ABC transporter ATP-binding protein [Candidatus Latescibacterota bacterium]
MDDPPAIIEVSDLSHAYPGRRGTPPTPALDRLSLRVVPGEALALLGPNGSGKSTLLRILTTSLRPTSGGVRIAGLDALAQPGLVRRLLGVVFQRAALDARLTVSENLRMAGRLYGVAGPLIATRSAQLLDGLGLQERRGERVGRLSGGLARRVELAKALLPHPRILLMDEPTSGLDPLARQDFWRQVRRLQQDGELTVVVSTHLMDEAQGCDRVAILHRGRLLACEPPVCLQQRLGRRVLTLHADDPAAVAQRVRAGLGLESRVVGSAVVVPLGGEVPLDRVLAVLGEEYRALTLAHPSLDDVFAGMTGEHLAAEGER